MYVHVHTCTYIYVRTSMSTCVLMWYTSELRVHVHVGCHFQTLKIRFHRLNGYTAHVQVQYMCMAHTNLSIACGHVHVRTCVYMAHTDLSTARAQGVRHCLSCHCLHCCCPLQSGPGQCPGGPLQGVAPALTRPE